MRMLCLVDTSAFGFDRTFPAKARASCWIALRENLSLHLLPSIAKLVEPIHSHVMLPRGGEQDPEMFELYISSLESGDLDKWFASWEKFEGWDYGSIGSRGARLPFEAPPVRFALVVHAIAHVVLGGAGGNAFAKENHSSFIVERSHRDVFASNHEHTINAPSTTSVREYFGENERWRVTRIAIWLGLLFREVW